MPPICRICFKKFRKDPKAVTLVRFKRTEEQILRLEQKKKAGHVAHPENAAWICNDHLELARSFKHLDIVSAFHEIRVFLDFQKE